MLIRDPVHGDIFLTPGEALVLDAEEIQRLRGIKQTGAGYLVYPGCVHTRFDHSLGTVFVAKRILANLRHKGFAISERQQDIVTAAALVHDVGHVPFGHTLEDEAGLFPRHDRARRLAWFLTGTDLADRLEQLSLLAPVRALLSGTDHPEIRPWMREIVTSTVDADMLDYLRRDSFFSGVRQQYDDRVFSYFVIAGDHLAMNLFKHRSVRPDARTEVLNLLRMRYVLTERLYLHHTKVIAGAMLAKGIERLIQRGLREEDLYGWQDADFFAALAGADDPVSRRLVAGVKRRRLLKRAFVLASPQVDDTLRAALIERFAGPSRASARAALEAELIASLNLRDGDVIVHCPEHSMFKEVKVLIPTPDDQLVPLDALDAPIALEVRGLARQYSDLWRFYVLAPPEAAARARAWCERYFGCRSTYLPEP